MKEEELKSTVQVILEVIYRVISNYPGTMTTDSLQIHHFEDMSKISEININFRHIHIVRFEQPLLLREALTMMSEKLPENFVNIRITEVRSYFLCLIFI